MTLIYNDTYISCDDITGKILSRQATDPNENYICELILCARLFLIKSYSYVLILRASSDSIKSIKVEFFIFKV